MNSGLLTIVIPTRDRPELLELCLRSVFERQTTIPNVIVSDNSTSEHPAIDALRRRYGFAYLRRSGEMNMTDHHNACLRLPSTRWMMLLHDDDELYPDSLSKVESFLAGCEDVAIVVGGLEYIDPQGKVNWEWIPEREGKFKGEDGLRRLGLTWHARPPNTIFSVAKSRHSGGYDDIGGLAADYTFSCRLAYSYGVAFLPERVGRFREGHERITNFSTPVNVEKHLQYVARMAQLLRPCSNRVADQLLDYVTWSFFLLVAPRWWDSHRAFVLGMCQTCWRLSPQPGVWQIRARSEYPFLFWRPQWLAQRLFRVARRLRYLLRRLTG